MSARVVHASDLVRRPWKNGGGSTAEIAVYPERADFETFGWRVSMADVGVDGPFSAFAGVDRTLILIEGNDIELDVNGVPYRLNQEFPKLSFTGDDQVAARLLSGPVRDLNIMTRRGTFQHRTRITHPGVALLHEDTSSAFVVAMDASLDVTLGDTIHSLRIHDTLVLEPTAEIVQLAGTGRAILIEMSPEVSALESHQNQ